LNLVSVAAAAAATVAAFLVSVLYPNKGKDQLCVYTFERIPGVPFTQKKILFKMTRLFLKIIKK
jgi:hypothetical protein